MTTTTTYELWLPTGPHSASELWLEARTIEEAQEALARWIDGRRARDPLASIIGWSIIVRQTVTSVVYDVHSYGGSEVWP